MSEEKKEEVEIKKKKPNMKILVFVAILIALFIIDRQGAKNKEQVAGTDVSVNGVMDENVIDSLAEKAADLKEEATEQLVDAKDAAKDIASDVKDSVKETADSATMMTSRWIEDLEKENQAIEEQREMAKEMAAEELDALEQKFAQAGQEAEKAVEEIAAESEAVQEDVEEVVEDIAAKAEVVQEDVQAVAEEVKEQIEETVSADLQTCKNKNFGVSFSCDLNWEVNEGKDKYSIVIAKDPEVVMTFEKVDQKIRFLGQITNEYLASTKEYKEGFNKTYSNFAGRKAIQLRGFSKKDAQRQDYFYVHNNQVHRVSFSIKSEDNVEKGREVVKEVVKEFAMLDTVE